MARVSCPKCGFEQEGGRECLRCGIIFDKYVPPAETENSGSAFGIPGKAVAAAESSPGGFRRFYRAVRWVVLAGLVLSVLLILHPSPPPLVDTDPQAERKVAIKMRQLERAVQTGRRYTLQLNEAELNQWLQSSLAMGTQANNGSRGALTRAQRRAAEAATGGALSKIAPPPAGTAAEPTLEEVRSSVQDVKINLVEDRVRAYLRFNLWGKDMSLLLEGRLFVQDGYLRLEPSSGKLGSMPIPQVSLDNAVRRLFDSPENREKFHVPDYVRDVRVENGELRVDYRR